MKNYLSLEELDNFLRPYKGKYITAYYRDIDPLNYFIFVRDKKTFNNLHNSFSDKKLEGPYESGRVIKVINIQKVLCYKWSNDIFTGDITRENFLMLEIVLIVTEGIQDSWLYINILLKLGTIYTEDVFNRILFRYLVSSGYKLKFSAIGKNVNMRKFLKIYREEGGRFSFWDLLCLSALYIKRKIILRVGDDHNQPVSFPNHEARKKFIEYIDKKFNLEGKYKLLNKEYDYVRALIAAEISGEKVFIKGDENTEEQCTLMNEIRASRKLMTLSEDERSLFCIMKFCDENKSFIVYPYLDGVSLSEYYESGGKLNALELDELGNFCIKVLDALDKIKITHRDLRPHNIIYNPKGKCKFKVVDFGCSCCDGFNRIGSNDYWDRELKKGLCSNFRYDKNIVDDAASLHRVYIFCGGNPDDEYSRKIKSLIGRSYI